VTMKRGTALEEDKDRVQIPRSLSAKVAAGGRGCVGGHFGGESMIVAY